MMSKKIHNSPLINPFLKFGNNIFVSDCRKSLTYLQSLDIINKFVLFFKSNRIFGKTVVLELPNSLDAQLIMLASLITNNTLLINPAHALLIKEKYQDLGFDVVIRSNQHVINHGDELEIVCLNQTEQLLKDEWFPGKLYLLTSGTTGQSKMFCIEHDEIVDYGTTYLEWAKFNDTDRLLNLGPFFHGYGLTRIFSVLSTGGSQYVCDITELRHLSNIKKFTWVSLVPSLVEFFNKCVDSNQVSTHLRFATVSASPCMPSLVVQFQNKFGIPLLAEYGCTEASVISSNLTEKNYIGTVGAVDRDIVKIVNGKIFVLPMWKNVPNWIDTGDLGSIDSDGNLKIVGREKEIIKKNGTTIYPYELEEHIQKIIGVEQAVVYPIKRNTTELIGLIYVGSIDRIKLIKKIKQNLNPVYFPDRVDLVEQIPTVANKIRRLELEKHVNTIK